MNKYTAGLVCPDCASDELTLLRDHNATLNDDTETGAGFHDFSKSPCGACGDRLHGARYAVAFWHEEDTQGDYAGAMRDSLAGTGGQP